ncbi:MAG: 6,7-dimethyl-8-ribityllumazine synthase [Candidatus Brocadiia bacterium]
MAKTFQGNLVVPKGAKFALVVSRFNDFITSRLLDGALDALHRHGADDSNIHIFRVPGAYEIPVVAKKLAALDYDAVICIGAVIRGDTPHFEYIAAEVAKGVAHVGLECSKPVVFGVLTTENVEQAIERAGTKSGNKGFEAAITAIEMIDLFGQIR